jgi:S-DNA-T family DNA segregation ATPase FtsK/SpoIIIE
VILQLGEVGVEGSPAQWEPSRQPHMLIVGQTGSGKTYFAKELTRQASLLGQVWVADAKGGGDAVGSSTSQLALGPEETVDLLNRAADVVGSRLMANRATGRAMSQEAPLWVFVDELSAVQLRHRGEDAKTSRDRRDIVQGALGEIALTGRSARVHLIVLLQRPDTDSLPGPIRDQLGLRVALGWMSPDGYKMTFGPVDLQPPRHLDPGNGWISGHVGHRDAPRLFFARSLPTRPSRYEGSQPGDTLTRRRFGRTKED